MVDRRDHDRCRHLLRPYNRTIDDGDVIIACGFDSLRAGFDVLPGGFDSLPGGSVGMRAGFDSLPGGFDSSLAG
jgi:hypothetical protein